ncbi:MAG: DUF1934 domain-containing protein [Blautia sp.]|jgi:uncharacterized beta-barrel protein YwiB (DUF1934 family)
MTKDVLIRVKGLQSVGEEDGADAPIEIVTVGEYYFRNGSHYLRYEELEDGGPGTTVNYIKFGETGLEVRKKGVTNVHMVFQEQKKNVTYYQTPYGSLQMGIAATKMNLKESENDLNVTVDYVLEMNDEYVADCYITIDVQPKGSPGFVL